MSQICVPGHVGYLLDPKISQLISNTLAKECIVVFDEARTAVGESSVTLPHLSL